MQLPIGLEQIIISVLCTISTGLLASAARELTLLRKSIEQLNVKMAVMIERIDHHETRIKKLERKENL